MTIIPDETEQTRMVEALLFAASEPLTSRDLSAMLPPGCDVGACLRRLSAHYEGRGVVLERLGEAWAFRTAADLGHLRQPVREEQRKLSQAGLEVLAVIAYHQPITRTEIETIRGVSVSAGTLDGLIDRGWVGFGRRRQSPGRPATFVTTDGFLDHFGLASIDDLPGLDDLRASGFLEPSPQADFLVSTLDTDKADAEDDEPDGLL